MENSGRESGEGGRSGGEGLDVERGRKRKEEGD